MKKFLSYAILFLGMPAVLGAAWTAFVVTMDYRSYMSALPAPSGLTVAVCGDSQTKDALDPSIVPGLFNFSTAAATPLQGEEAMVALAQTAQPVCSILGYRSFNVDGVDVEQIDYVWASQPILQSMVTVHLEDKNVIILFAALTSIENALEEYTAIINTLGIVD